MSSVILVRSQDAEGPRFPPQCTSAEGESILRVFLSKRGSSLTDKSLIFDYMVCNV